MSGLTEERNCSSNSWLQSGLYEFTGCVIIKGLFLLDIIHDIDCYAVFGGQITTLKLRKTEMNRTLRLTMCNWLSCPAVKPLLLIFIRQRWAVFNNWLLVSASSCPVVIPPPGAVVRRRNNPILDDRSLAILPFVCRGQKTTFAWRQIEDNSFWELILHICPSCTADRTWCLNLVKRQTTTIDDWFHASARLLIA